ncbi:hypothetical protein [Saccharopolyspora spinosa]|uniref:hypothetical protein n=1 Tax=Saccharopolyspora spinosa TaxID=60894 RepID=UPI00376F1E9A
MPIGSAFETRRHAGKGRLRNVRRLGIKLVGQPRQAAQHFSSRPLAVQVFGQLYDREQPPTPQQIRADLTDNRAGTTKIVHQIHPLKPATNLCSPHSNGRPRLVLSGLRIVRQIGHQAPKIINRAGVEVGALPAVVEAGIDQHPDPPQPQRSLVKSGQIRIYLPVQLRQIQQGLLEIGRQTSPVR